MKFSKNWLLEWVNPNVSTDELAKKFTNLGFEVETIMTFGNGLSLLNVVVAEIVEAVPHPDAEKLQVCNVTDGKEIYQIVCGAKNARAGIKVVLAKIDAVLPNGLKIGKAKLRGVESFGMLCSVSELGMADTSEGILELPSSAPLGKNITDYFNEANGATIEVSITPNRGDCLSIKGLAREIAAAYELSLNTPPKKTIPINSADFIKVNVAKSELCPRYCARVIKGIKPYMQTPDLYVDRLRAAGIRSIHPVVDITNYVMLEMGQPMHAFDFAKISGDIEVRLARADEKLTLLDDNTLDLRSDTLVIADAQTPLAIAGIMGGKESAVTIDTTDIILESAFFSPDYMMGHARHYNITTDSSQRFERGVDPEITLEALNRATQLILEICGGVAIKITEVVTTNKLPQIKKITLRRARIARILGITIADKEIVRILESLGMSVIPNEQGWDIQTPTWRFDLTIEVDLIEELARVYGLDHIPAQFPVEQLIVQTESESVRSPYALKQKLASCGYHETLTYSFIDPSMHALLFPKQDGIKLINPLSADLSVMRISLWPNLLNALISNQNYQQERVRLFEVGRVFLPNENKIAQPLHLSGIVSGGAFPEQWGIVHREADFFDVKGDLELLLKSCGAVQFKPIQNSILHPGQSAEILVNNKLIGTMGALHPSISQQLKLTSSVILFELDLEKIAAITIPQYGTVSKFPAIRRDVAMIVEETITLEQVYDIVRNAAGTLLTELAVFDVYRGTGIELGHKSLALRLTLQTSNRTLKEEEINQILEQVTMSLKTKLNAQLR